MAELARRLAALEERLAALEARSSQASASPAKKASPPPLLSRSPRRSTASCARARDAFLAGIERYRHHPYRRALADPPALWQDGTTRLLDYGAAGDAGAAGRAVAHQPRLYPRSHAGDEPAALSRRRRAAAAAGRLGRAGRGRARLRPHRLYRRPARGGARARRRRRRAPRWACWAIAWAGCWRWRWPSAGRDLVAAPGAAGDARGASMPSAPARRGFWARSRRRWRSAARALRRGAGRRAAGAVHGRSIRCVALRKFSRFAALAAGPRRGARFRRGRGLAQ